MFYRDSDIFPGVIFQHSIALIAHCQNFVFYPFVFSDSIILGESVFNYLIAIPFIEVVSANKKYVLIIITNQGIIKQRISFYLRKLFSYILKGNSVKLKNL